MMENNCENLTVTSADTSGNNTGEEYGGWYESGGTYTLGSVGFRFIDNSSKTQATELVTDLLNGTNVGVSAYNYAGSVEYNH